MPGKADIDHETMDLYRQLLGDAQKMEDLGLAEMVRKRLAGQRQRPLAESGGENIILFPHRRALCPDPETDLQFWIQSQFWMDLGKLLLILIVIGGWACLPFINVIKASMQNNF